MHFFNNIPCLPVRVEHDVSYYTTEQIDLYGFPDTWGVYNYLVISSLNYEKPCMTDWKYEQYMFGTLRPIHRYSRLKRFQSTLYQLLGFLFLIKGLRGDVSAKVVKDISKSGYNKDPSHIWDSIRFYLKKNGLRKYYNRISTIIAMLGLPFRIKFPDCNEFLLRMSNNFLKISSQFDSLSVKRKYFINIRYIVIKMLLKENVKFEFEIPLVRTKRKLRPLDNIWSLIKY